MPDFFRTKLVVNPRSANGRTEKNWPRIEKQVRAHVPDFDYEFTNGPMDATRIARESLRQGYEMIVTVGGDGTNNEVMNGFFENGAPVRENAVLGMIPMGTGGDFVRTVRIPKTIPEAAAHLAGAHTIPCDAGHITYTNHQGETEERYFLNIADFGAGGHLVDRVNHSTKALGGFMSFFIGMARTTLTYKDQPVRIEVDGRDIGSRVIRSVIIANGRYCGGGMRIARNAEINDGVFEIIIISSLTKSETVRLIPKFYSGDIINFEKKVESFHGRTLKADSDETLLLDIDGEQPGRLPATFRVLPGVLRLKTLPPPIAD